MEFGGGGIRREPEVPFEFTPTGMQLAGTVKADIFLHQYLIAAGYREATDYYGFQNDRGMGADEQRMSNRNRMLEKIMIDRGRIDDLVILPASLVQSSKAHSIGEDALAVYLPKDVPPRVESRKV